MACLSSEGISYYSDMLLAEVAVLRELFAAILERITWVMLSTWLSAVSISRW